MPVIGIGQCSLDRLAVVGSFPEPDTKTEVLQFEEQGGGPVATALVALSRLNVPCRFHGITGDDDAGGMISQSLINEKVDAAGLIRRNGASSQIAFIVIEQHGGRRTIFWKRPTGEPLRPEELRRDFLQDADMLLLDGLMKDVSLFAAREAKKRGISVMLDAGRMRAGMLELARLCDYVVASEEFSRDLGWDDDPERIRQGVKEQGFSTTTITLGARGSVTIAKDEIIMVPAFPVEAVDTTGAGDVFHGGYIYGLLRQWDLLSTVRFASALAAMKCRKVGGRAGIPGLEEVFQFLKENGVRGPETRTRNR